MQDRPWRRDRECTASQGEHNPNRITWKTDAPDGSQAFSVPERTGPELAQGLEVTVNNTIICKITPYHLLTKIFLGYAFYEPRPDLIQEYRNALIYSELLL